MAFPTSAAQARQAVLSAQAFEDEKRLAFTQALSDKATAQANLDRAKADLVRAQDKVLAAENANNAANSDKTPLRTAWNEAIKATDLAKVQEWQFLNAEST